MTTYYVRPTTGSDTNDGLTPATAWQTLTGTSSILAPGDEVRVQGTTLHTVHASCTWSFGQTTITVPTQLTLNIFLCESPFTQAMQPSVVLGTSPTRKQGSVSSTISVAAGTSGPLAYRTLATVNASAFQQVCFWIRSSVALPPSTLALELCSDAVGAVVLLSLLVDYPLPALTWVPIVINTNAALPNNIQSIRLTALSTITQNTTVFLDNIFCARAASLSNTVTLHSLVGLQPTVPLPFEELLFPVRFVEQVGSTTVIGFDGRIDDTAPTPKGRIPLSGTFPLYRVDPLVLPPALTPDQDYTTPHPLRTPWGSVQASGSAAAPIVISGDWDAASMSTQSPSTPTAIMCLTPNGEGLRFNSQQFVQAERLRFSGFARGAVLDGRYLLLRRVRFYRTTLGMRTELLASGDEPVVGIENFQIVGGSAPQMLVQHGKVVGAYGVFFAGRANEPCVSVFPDANRRRPSLELQRVYTWDCGYPLRASSDVLIRGGDFTLMRDTPSYSLVVAPPTVFEPKIILCDSIFTPSPVAEQILPGMDYSRYEIRYHQPNYSLVDHRIVMDTGVIVPDQVVFQTPPRSWRFTPNAKARASNPMVMPLGPLWRQGSSSTAVQVVVRRDHPNIRVRVRVFGGQVFTINNNQAGIAVEDTGPINAWNTITIPVSALVSSGTFDAQVEVWTTDGGTTYNCWVDSVT